MADPKILLEHALKIGALTLNPEGVKLKSGRISPHFFNSGLFRTGQDISLLAEAYANALQDYMNTVEAVYGPPYKGIPLATAISLEIWKKKGIATACAWSRKEAKDHGEGGIHGGAPLKGLGVAIVDDVITSGGSVHEAFAYVQAQGGYPTVCAIGFDRMECGVESEESAAKIFSRQHHIPVLAAARLTDLIELLEQRPDIHPKAEETLSLIHAYRTKYGAE